MIADLEHRVKRLEAAHDEDTDNHRWLFDLYPSREGITLWLVDRDGAKYRCHDGLTVVYMHIPEARERVGAIVRLFPFVSV